jgi:oxygen-independent coproporphyrinogen-3 oxidase
MRGDPLSEPIDRPSPVGVSPGRPSFRSLPPLSLYVHIPWCLRKCPYCDFNSHEKRGELPEADYVAALLADLEHSLPAIWGRPVHTVFFGGGTPSLLAPASIDAILAGVRARVTLVPGAEVTLEANPGTFEQQRFEGFRDAGVTRLSIGVQSFDAGCLRAIGRVHDDREARRAVESALALFATVNVDLMFALPGQTLAQAGADVTTLLDYAPAHVSLYHLSIEPNTLFHRQPPPLPDEDLAFDMQEMIESRLGAAGYAHYETSAYAKPGHRCRHNLNYWQFGDYLGIGAGAHSKISFPERIVREIRFKQPQQYLRQVAGGQPVIESREIERKEVGFEFMLNAMRLTEGVPVSLFQERTGFPPSIVARQLDDAVRRGLIERNHLRIAPTALGRRFLNELQSLFL